MIDLHMHSLYSDGMYSPDDLMAKVAEKKLKAVALTDHDSILGCLEFAKAGEICVKLGGSSRCVHYLDVAHLVAVIGKQLGQSCAKLALLKRGELVADTAEQGIEEGDKQAEEEHHRCKDQQTPDGVGQNGVQAVLGILAAGLDLAGLYLGNHIVDKGETLAVGLHHGGLVRQAYNRY